MAQPTFSSTVAIYSYPIPGLVVSETEGTLIDLLNQVNLTSRYQYQLNLMPASRVQASFAEKHIQGYFPELEQFRPASSCRTSAFMQKGIIAFVLKGQQPIYNIDQLAGKRVGIVKGFSYGEEILARNDIEFVAVSNDYQNLKKLRSGRIDAILGDIHSTVHAINASHQQSFFDYDASQPVRLLDVFFVFQDEEYGRLLCADISEQLEKLALLGLLEKWFGYTPLPK